MKKTYEIREDRQNAFFRHEYTVWHYNPENGDIPYYKRIVATKEELAAYVEKLEKEGFVEGETGYLPSGTHKKFER